MKIILTSLIALIISYPINCEESPEVKLSKNISAVGSISDEPNFNIDTGSSTTAVGFIVGENRGADNIFDQYKNIKPESNFVLYVKDARSNNVPKEIVISTDPGLPNISTNNPSYRINFVFNKLISILKENEIGFEVVELKDSKDSMLVVGKNKKKLSIIKLAISESLKR